MGDGSLTKGRVLKTRSLGREIRKKQFENFPVPMTSQDTMNLIVESFLEGDDGYCIDPKHVVMPDFEKARSSNKANGLIEAYAANTN